MVASSGPPTADSFVDRAALAKLSLRIDAKGFKVFVRKFQSALGTHYQKVITYAIATDNLEPVDPRAIELHGKVYDMLVGTFTDAHDDILLDMETYCNALGPKALQWLKARYPSSDLPTALGNMMSVWNGTISSNAVVADINGIVTLNASAERLRIPDELLCALLLMKLPAEFNNVRDNVIFDDALPSLDELIGKVQSAVNFKPAISATAHMAFAGIGTQRGRAQACYNCDGPHSRGACPLPSAACDECGQNAGHISKYCFVINYDRALPSSIQPDAAAKIEKKRAAYKLKKAATGTGVNAMVPGWDSDEDLSWLEQLERDPTFRQPR